MLTPVLGNWQYRPPSPLDKVSSALRREHRPAGPTEIPCFEATGIIERAQAHVPVERERYVGRSLINVNQNHASLIQQTCCLCSRINWRIQTVLLTMVSARKTNSAFTDDLPVTFNRKTSASAQMEHPPVPIVFDALDGSAEKAVCA